MPFKTGFLSSFQNLDISSEVIDTGDGTTTAFNIDLGKLPIFLNSVVIKYTISGVDYVGTTDDSGTITGTDLSGNIDENGDGSLNFSTAPDDTIDITADYRIKGFLQTLIDFCSKAPTDDILGTGDGTTTTFSTTLSTAGTLAEGQTRVRFKIGIQEYDVWDDGIGTFDHHDFVASSSLNKATKQLNIEFSEPITDGYEIHIMSNDGLPGQDWIILTDYLTRTNDGISEAFPGDLLKTVILKNSGTTYREIINAGIRETKNIAGQFFSLNLMLDYRCDENSVFKDFVNSSSYNGTYESYNRVPQVPMDNIDLTYWIFSTKNKIIGIIRSSGGVYSSFYIGAGLRFADPESYPRALICLSSCSEDLKVTSTDSDFNGLLKATNYAIIAYDNNGNKISSADYVKTSHQTFGTGGDTQSKIPMTNGEIAMTPVQAYTIRYAEDPGLPLVELEGVFGCSSNTIASEDILNDNEGYENIIFQESFRTAAYNYFCVRKE